MSGCPGGSPRLSRLNGWIFFRFWLKYSKVICGLRSFGKFHNTKYLNLDKLQDVSGINLYTIMYTMSFTKGWATLKQI